MVLSVSRTFGLNIRGKFTMSMAPFADMLNHKNPMECRWYFDNKTNCFTVEAVENIPFGAPIHYSYGETRSTREFYLNYGFVIYPHDLDEANLLLGIKSED